MKKGGLIYFTTVGYTDQFGSNKNKKMTTRNFKRKLSQICGLPMNEQEMELDRFFQDWRTGNEQTDHGLVAGIKL